MKKEAIFGNGLSRKTFLSIRKRAGGRYIVNCDEIVGIHVNADGCSLVLSRGGIDVAATGAQLIQELRSLGHEVRILS